MLRFPIPLLPFHSPLAILVPLLKNVFQKLIESLENLSKENIAAFGASLPHKKIHIRMFGKQDGIILIF